MTIGWIQLATTHCSNILSNAQLVVLEWIFHPQIHRQRVHTPGNIHSLVKWYQLLGVSKGEPIHEVIFGDSTQRVIICH